MTRIKEIMRIKNSLILVLIIIAISLSNLVATGLSYAAEDYQIYSQKKIIDIAWGLAPEEFGLTTGTEIERIGPRTFSLDRNGNIYIFDCVKRNMKKFTNEGDYQGNVGSNISGSAIAVGDEGYFFVSDNHIIHEYSPSGDLIKDYEISENLEMIEGYGQGIMIDNFDNLYITKLQRVYKIGNTKQRTLLEQKQQIGSKKKGLHGKDDVHRFQTKWENKHEAKIQVLNNQGNLLKELLVNTSDIFGAVLFLKQDKQSLIYVEVERITRDNYVHLEVRKCDIEGNFLTIIELPNDYYTTVYKKIEVDTFGKIYQLLTTPEGVQIIKWEQKQKER